MDLFLEDDPLSPRYVLAHVKHLKTNSAYAAEIRGGQQYRGWDEDRYQQVAMIETMRTLLYAFIMANSDPDKSKPKRPDPYPIPDPPVKLPDRPGSFGFVAKQHFKQMRKQKVTSWPKEELAEKK